MDELISVIVPVYNVEKYLKKCIESLIKQTYEEIEIILVNDGSTDRSGELCDSFKQIDKRVKVFSKKNGGLSDARNFGIKNSKGNYIMFVDSDDYLPIYAIEHLYMLLKNNDANIAIGSLMVTTDRNIEYGINSYEVISFDKKTALAEMLYADKFSTSAPAKLFKKSLFFDIEFPKGKLYEDLYTIYRVIDKADKVIYSSAIVYYYYHRPGSITASKFSEKKLDAIFAMREIKKNIDIKEYGIERAFNAQLIEIIFSFLKMDITNEDVKKYKLWSVVKKCRLSVLFDLKVPKRLKGYSIISCFGRFITMKIVKYYYRKKFV